MSFFHQSRARLLRRVFQKINQGEAEILLAYACKTSREDIFSHPEKLVPLLQAWCFLRLVKKRRANFPIAYLTREKEFFGLVFKVNRHTLIPRPETEIMVEEIIHNFTTKKTKIFDIGTGSGCIAIALAKKLPHATVFASDTSSAALRVARLNAKNNQTNIEFRPGELLTPWKKYLQNKSTDEEIIITANLPYLTNAQFVQEKSIQREPKTALVSDEQDGLDLYRKLCKEITDINQPLTLYFEIDPDQTEKIKALFSTFFPNRPVDIYKDLCGLDRIVSVRVR